MRPSRRPSAKVKPKLLSEERVSNKSVQELLAEGKIFGGCDKESKISNNSSSLVASDDSGQRDKILKPLAPVPYLSSEWAELAESISQNILNHNPNVHWDDIIGLDEAKQLIKEAVVYSTSYPELFSGILSPWKGLLLYGPPGTRDSYGVHMK
ncbi:unnamed protein product [Hymenolepis diminuta]|uniref:Uncharacterized protein n=1 Tax=Hymenolepis diminuta TaxID=6216 RepID=A0A564XX17_HYMDI|nr:unnamed protein product [Hymenolepis diminuta]